MSILSTIVLVLAIIVAIVFSLLVLVTGKGDAMSGGGSVRTTYKGKATFDDIMSRAALYLGISFMVLVLLYNVVSTKASNAPSTSFTRSSAPAPAPTNTNTAPAVNNAPASNNGPAANTPAANTPATNAPATNGPATNGPATNVPATNAPAGNNAPK